MEGISAFTIGVGDTFDGANFYARDFTTCTTFPRYPKHGDFNNTFTCNTAQRGRYVAIYADYRGALPNPVSICEVAVHAQNRKCKYRSTL